MKKPREIYITLDGDIVSERWKENPGFIIYREVLPDEPDLEQKLRIAQESINMLEKQLDVAIEALEEIAGGVHVLCEGMSDSKTTSKLNFNNAYCDCYIKDAREALKKIKGEGE